MDAAAREQIVTDPRVVALANSRATRTVSTAELRQFGYAVPDDTMFRMGYGRNANLPHLYLEHDKWDDIIVGAGAALLTFGVSEVFGNVIDDNKETAKTIAQLLPAPPPAGRPTTTSSSLAPTAPPLFGDISATTMLIVGAVIVAALAFRD